MKKFTALTAVAVLFAFSGVASAEMDGPTVYKNICAACHGAKGQGTPMAPAYVGNKFVTEGSNADIFDVIRNGRKMADKVYKQYPIEMPAQKKLKDGEINAVIAYIKDLAKG